MIDIDIKGVKKAQHLLKGMTKETPKAFTRAINHSLAKARTQIKKETKKEYYIKSKDVNDALTLRKATFKNVKGTIRARGPILGLHKFKVSLRKKGLFVGIKRSLGMKLRKKAFMVRVANFTGKSGKNKEATFSSSDFTNRILQRKGDERMPIRESYGASIPGLIGNSEISKSIIEGLEKNIEERVGHEIRRIIGGLR